MRQSPSCRPGRVVTILRLMQATSPRLWLCVVSALVLAGGAPCGNAAEPAGMSGEQTKFFETHVRPLLVEQCYSGHGEKKQKGGLRLDSAEGVRKGGKNGAVVVAGKPG